MAFLGGLRVLLDAATDSFNVKIADSAKKLESTKTAMNRSLAAIEKGFDSLGDKLGELGHHLFTLEGAIGAVLGGSSLTLLLKNSIDTADAIGKMADRTGTSVEALQGLQYAAKQSDISIESLENALTQLNKRIGSAAAGGENPFAQYGISIRDAAGHIKSADQVLENIADTFVKASNGGAQAKLAFDTMGKAGAQMGVLLKGGGDGIRAMREEAEKLGLILDEQTVRRAEAFNDQLNNLGQVIRVNFQGGLLHGFLNDSANLKAIYSDPQFINGIRLIGEEFGKLFSFVIQHSREILSVSAAFGGAWTGAKAGRLLGPQGAGIGAAIGGTTAFIAAYIATAKDASDATDQLGDDASKLKDRMGGLQDVLASTADTSMDKFKQSLEDAHFELYKLRGGFDEVENKIADVTKAAGLLKFNGESWVVPHESVESIADLSKTLTEIGERKDAAQVIQDTKTATEKYAEQVERLNTLLQDGYLTQEQYNRGLAKAQDELAKSDENSRRLSDAARDLGMTFSSAFEDAIVGGKSFKDILSGLEQDIMRIVTRLLVTQPLANTLTSWLGGATGSSSGGSSGGGLLGSVFSSISSFLPKFATGGRFQVGSLGGVDSQLVAFRASPWEQVSVTNPGQQMNGGGATIVMNIQTPDANSFQRSQNQLMARAQSLMHRANLRNS